MKSEVLGYKHVNFTDQASGRQIVGYSVYLSQPLTEAGSAGVEATKVFLGNWESPFLGKADVDINLKGKVVNITQAK